MLIILRCYNCESINEIPKNYRYRICKGCEKIISYQPGEAIICSDISGIHKKFIDSKYLTKKLAERFFEFADSDASKISEIILEHEERKSILLDIPAASVADTVLFILRNLKENTIDDLIRNSTLFDISLTKLEKILLQLKKEGLIYQPQGWLINLI
ncbi:MAG: hypothetical protein KAS63_00525 [Candidatus Heimdallarchaeota archaeon]|nr:hypothetical protein [Candidatus Heimdallarchaeota archaeon]MCK4953827.1 hypothetical protein [Candidatus Heimdallarchaeota archaeon]